MKLTNVEIHKYKSIEKNQSFKIEDGLTVLVGMNEAGKTSVLEAIAKVNYFTKDEEFKFNTTHDYPRKEKKKLDKSGDDPVAVTLTFELDDKLISEIEEDLGKEVFSVKTISYSKKYSGRNSHDGIVADLSKFIDIKLNEFKIINDTLASQLKKCKNTTEFAAVVESMCDETIKGNIEILENYFENDWNWQDPLSEYVARTYISPNIPKFLYYDEYYALPSEVVIEELASRGMSVGDGEYKTAKALFELADINIDELLNADDFEDYVAELEATQALISNELFKYWSTNNNLKIRFAIDKKVERKRNQYNSTLEDKILQHRLNIRVENTRNDMTLPLKNRSKGFNWFFSFLVWFKKIQEDKNSNYILLLDEPGLNLHAKAQEDLLRFFEDLALDYQTIYTTHSPFMIDSAKLSSVRTVVETDTGTRISDTIQEKDPKTLFPLQAALGYTVAQNLFISKKNLLVEGVSDLIYLTVISDLLKANGKTSLNEDITIVPVGGLDKVTTFISLLGANKLNIVCLLDSFIDQKGKARLEDLIRGNIIKQKSVKFFDEYVTAQKADIEDLFEKSEYLKLFNEAFSGEYKVDETSLDSGTPNILGQIGKVIGKSHFNHYRPAKLLAAKGVDISFFSSDTLGRFEAVFRDVNKLLQ